METLRFKIEGVSPLLMHSDRLVNPLDPIKKMIVPLTSKRKKTDEDHEQIAALEFEAGFYFDEKLGPVIPAQNIEAMIKKAATRRKLGTTVVAGLMVIAEHYALEYEGPRTIKALWKRSAEFADMRSVVIQRARTMRCRPMFREWRLQFEIAYDAALLDAKTVGEIIEDGSKYVGLGDYRPRFGRFKVAA